MDGSASLDVGALDLVGEVVAEVRERGLGVGGRAGDGELVRAGVLDLDGGLLVAGADDALEGTLVAVVRVGLHGHGGPVGADPELDVGVHGTAVGGHVDLDELLVDVGELPGATGLAEDALLVTDVGGLGGGAEGGSPAGAGGADVEVGGGAAGLLGGEGGGGTGEEGSEGELHLDCTILTTADIGDHGKRVHTTAKRAKRKHTGGEAAVAKQTNGTALEEGRWGISLGRLAQRKIRQNT